MAQDVQITFDGELSELKSSLDSMQSDIRRWGSNVSAIGVGAFAAWGATKVFDGVRAGLSELASLVKEFVAIAEEAAQVDAQLTAAVESTGRAAGFTANELKAMASDLQSFTTYGDEAIKTAQTMILQFRNIKGEQFERVTELALDMAARLGGEASAAAQQLGKALNDPIRGMQLLERQGITLTESQQDVVKTLVATGQTSQAQGVLLDELAKLYGGAAEAAAQASGGGFKQFKEIVGDIKESIGAELIPALDELSPAFKFEAKEIGSEIVALIQQLTGLANSVTESFGTTAAEKFVGAIAIVRQELEKVVAHLKVWIAYSVRAGEIAKNPLSALPTGGRATAAERALDRAKENLEALQTRDPLIAANEAIERFRAAVKQEEEERTQRQKDREERRGSKAEDQVDPNILAFTKAFPNITADLNGLKEFGQQIQGKAGDMFGGVAGLGKEVAAGVAGIVEDVAQPFADAFMGSQKEEFSASFESLGGLFSRIQASAASTETQREEKKIELAQKTAEETKNSVSILGGIKAGIDALVKGGGKPAVLAP